MTTFGLWFLSPSFDNIWASIVSSNGLLPESTKPLPECIWLVTIDVWGNELRTIVQEVLKISIRTMSLKKIHLSRYTSEANKHI